MKSSIICIGHNKGWDKIVAVKIGSLLGIPVKLHYTLILAVFLIAWTLAVGFMPSQYLGLSVVENWSLNRWAHFYT